MRVRALVAGFGVAVAVGTAVAQPQPGRFPLPPADPQQPRAVPFPLAPPASLAPPAPLAPPVPLTPPLPVAPPSVVAPPTQLSALPYPENLTPFDAGLLTSRRAATGWQVALGPRVFRELGEDEVGARDIVRTLRELRPTEWCAIGTGRVVVEYGLQNGKPPPVGGFPRGVTPIDLRTVRVDAVRGVWVVRDDTTIHFNCGLHRPDAEQTAAAIRRYGFNRVGTVGGNPAAPALTYLFATLDGPGAAPAAVHPLAAVAAEQSLTRVGIPVPGVGYFGEMVQIDPHRIDVRKVGGDWVLASGTEVLAHFGPAEFTARDAARVVQEGRFTEFCRAGGQTFFLSNGRAPTRVPFSAVGRRFDPGALRVGPYGTRWAVTENGRSLFEAADQAEAEGLLRLVKHLGFDTVCQIGNPPRAGMTFFAKGR